LKCKEKITPYNALFGVFCFWGYFFFVGAAVAPCLRAWQHRTFLSFSGTFLFLSLERELFVQLLTYGMVSFFIIYKPHPFIEIAL